MKRLALLGVLLTPALAQATGFTDFGNDIQASPDIRYGITGNYRLRTEMLGNLDLDRGPTPSGELFFPVSQSDPGRQVFYYTDMRLRTDLSFYAPGGMVAVKARVDVLDNLAAGSLADDLPGATPTQNAPEAAFRVKRAYGELVTPVGYIGAGRMGAHWGLGMMVNGGDCADCDSGDAADRVAFITPLFGHIVGVAYDFSATGYQVKRADEVRAVEIEPAASVRSFSLVLLRYNDPAAHKRRKNADKWTFDYGVTYAHRSQARDIPSSYLPIANPPEIDAAQVVERGLSAHVADAYFNLDMPFGRIDFEAAAVMAEVNQTSFVPGLTFNEKATSRQFGAALESNFGPRDGEFALGLDAGYASGDAAPGFGARPTLARLTPTKTGDLNGPQATLMSDRRVDNFRFHRDYRIDKILFREIIGTVTDAVYLRPHARYRVFALRGGEAVLTMAAIASWANYAESTPGGKRPLGLELDPTLSYQTEDGLLAALDYAVLFPFAGLDNPQLGLQAKTAQLVRLRVGFGF